MLELARRLCPSLLLPAAMASSEATLDVLARVIFFFLDDICPAPTSTNLLLTLLWFCGPLSDSNTLPHSSRAFLPLLPLHALPSVFPHGCSYSIGYPVILWNKHRSVFCL